MVADAVSTNRTPIQRRPTVQVTKRAIELYVVMGKLRCTCPQPKPPTHSPCPGCERWYDLHGELHVELGCKPWEYPCVVPKTPSMAGSSGFPLSDPEGKATLARMAALDEAVAFVEAEEET